MRTLNKTLCLVLAVVMVLGMFGVATAADFTDAETIQYEEAVDVMVGIGAINGMGDGTFAPAATVTRAQAAKMVAYAVLGADIAATLPVVASSFTDVDSNFAWAIPSIEYLVKQGVINGRGDGTFDPAGEVTAYEIAKMLLVAAGYGKNGEFTGNSWALNVAIVAQREKVFAGTKATELSAAATREECALYCFNVLTKVEQVVYSKDKSAYEAATPVATIGTAVYTLASPEATDTYGYVGHKWTVGSAATAITGVYIDDVIVDSFTTTVGMNTDAMNLKYKILDSLGGKDINEVKVFVNKTERGLVKNFINTTINGAKIDLVDTKGTDGKIDKVVVTLSYLAKVDKVNPAQAATATDAAVARSVDLTVYDYPTTVTQTKVVTEDFAKGDYILVTPSADTTAGFAKPLAMALAKTERASLTGYTNASVTTASGTYKFSTFIEMPGSLDFTTVYDLYFDAFGNVIGIVEYEAAAATTLNYAYVNAVQSKAAAPATLLTPATPAVVKVKVTYLDGTSEVLDYDVKVASADIGAEVLKGQSYITYTNSSGKAVNVVVDGTALLTAPALYSYVKTDDGKLVLSEVTTLGTVIGTDMDDTQVLTLKKGEANVDAAGTLLYANSATKLVVITASGVNTITGYQNFPAATYTVATGGLDVVYVKNGSTITNILVLGATPETPDPTFSYGVYVKAGNTVATGQMHTFYVNGAMKEYLVPTGSTITVTAGTVYAMTINDKGQLTDTSNTLLVDSFKVDVLDSTYIATGSDAPVYFAESHFVFNISSATATNWAIDTLEAGDTVTYLKNTDGKIVALWITTEKA